MPFLLTFRVLRYRRAWKNLLALLSSIRRRKKIFRFLLHISTDNGRKSRRRYRNVLSLRDTPPGLTCICILYLQHSMITTYINKMKLPRNAFQPVAILYGTYFPNLDQSWPIAKWLVLMLRFFVDEKKNQRRKRCEQPPYRSTNEDFQFANSPNLKHVGTPSPPITTTKRTYQRKGFQTSFFPIPIHIVVVTVRLLLLL